MKSTITYLILVIVAIGAIMTLTAQAPSQQNIPSKDESNNFFAIQKKFYDSWEGKTPQRGMGYKQFKRWEYFMSSRVQADGTIPNYGPEIWSINNSDWQGYLSEKSRVIQYLPSDYNLDTHTTIHDFNLIINNAYAEGIDWIKY